MTGYITDYKGAVSTLPPLLSWDIKHGLGEPCDAFEVSFQYPPLKLGGTYLVRQSRCWADESGAGTVLTLAKA